MTDKIERDDLKGDALAQEQAQLERSGRLHGLHWFIIALSLIVTLFAWQAATYAQKERLQLRFDRQAELTVNLFTEQLQRYADVLRSSAGFVSSSESVTPAEWRRFAGSLDLSNQFPAISGIGVVRHVSRKALPGFLAEERKMRPDLALFPDHDQAFHLPLVHIYPERFERSTIGLDLAFESRRREAINRAGRLNDIQITAPIELNTTKKLGIVMFAPFYGEGPVSARWESNSLFAGAAVASVIMENLANGVLAKENRAVWVRIVDNNSLLYDEHDAAHDNLDPAPLFVEHRTVSLLGREWQFDIHSTLAFRADAAGYVPQLVLLGGLTIDALLIALFLLLSRSNRYALGFAERMATSLRTQGVALEISNRTLEERNEELKTFAYMVSHDLKQPLRGIEDLTGFLREDLEPCVRSGHAPPEVEDSMRLIDQQVQRASSLIKGILDYSRLGTSQEQIARVDARALIQQIGQMLQRDDTQLQLTGEFPVFETYETRLDQVLSNLIGNAFKYHHDSASALVTVTVVDRPQEAFYQFTITDNGPGIDSRFHDYIFEVFKTLQCRDSIESTGIGLSIVKKTVEQLDGKISVHSEPGQGTSFVFEWPRSIGQSAQLHNPEDGLSRAA